MVLENDGVVYKTTKEKVKSLALKAKVTREQTGDDSDTEGGSGEDEDESEEFNLIARNFRMFFHKGNHLGMEINLVAGEINLEDATCMETASGFAATASEVKGNDVRKNVNPSSPPGSPTSPVSRRVRELEKLLEYLGIIVAPPTGEPSCLEGEPEFELVVENKESGELEEEVKEEIKKEEEEDDLEYFNTFPIKKELEYHEWL
ncbi:hypothetical protein Tco_0007231 [Tanacetum coccineum]